MELTPPPLEGCLQVHVPLKLLRPALNPPLALSSMTTPSPETGLRTLEVTVPFQQYIFPLHSALCLSPLLLGYVVLPIGAPVSSRRQTLQQEWMALVIRTVPSPLRKLALRVGTRAD